MKKLLLIAALLLTSGAAQAQYTFEYGGRTIHIDPDRGTVSIPGIYDNSGGRWKKARSDPSAEKNRKAAPEQAKVDPQPSPEGAPPAAPAQQAAPPSASQTEPPAATANNAPADTTAVPPPEQPAAPAPPVQRESTSDAKPSTAIAAAPPALPVQPPQNGVPAEADARDPNSPVGVWLTEEKKGKVRIEMCGANLCGYAVDRKSDQNGKQILINMKPGRDQKWSGRIFDPSSGSTYDSTIALRGPDRLRVQGCAFGGMFCGGQTWTRVN